MDLPLELVEKAVENLTSSVPELVVLVVLCFIFARLLALAIKTRNGR